MLPLGVANMHVGYVNLKLICNKMRPLHLCVCVFVGVSVFGLRVAAGVAALRTDAAAFE